MNQPKIELRAIQTSAFASEETHCYTATLYVDGLKWGSVSNEGHGGADHFHGVDGKSYADLKALDAQIAATYPESDVSYLYGEETPAGTHMQTESLETLCGEIVNAHLMAKELKRAMGRKVMFTKPGQPGIYEIPLKQKGRVWQVEQVVEAITKKTPGAIALNMMPFDQALAIFRAYAAA
jgi:hypothetical protein